MKRLSAGDAKEIFYALEDKARRLRIDAATADVQRKGAIDQAQHLERIAANIGPDGEKLTAEFGHNRQDRELVETLAIMSRSDEVPPADLDDSTKALNWAISNAREIVNAE